VIDALKIHRHPQVPEILKKLTNDIDISICEAAYDALTDLCVSVTADVDASREAQEIGAVAAFLASPKSGAITGEVIAAGGGPSRAVYY
jgi:enoyl-[acyl-carrier-protein] reductase (NADH)